jgi:hypothetical protein
MLQRDLKTSINSKRGRPSEGVLLLHNNAHPHTATSMLETLRKLKWGVMAHRAHSPDLAPPGTLKEALERKRFQCDEDVKNAVHQWPRVQPETFYL